MVFNDNKALLYTVISYNGRAFFTCFNTTDGNVYLNRYAISATHSGIRPIVFKNNKVYFGLMLAASTVFIYDTITDTMTEYKATT